MKALLALLAVLVLIPQAASAIITFTQLDDDVFTVSHRVKLIGSRARATKLVYTKAASLCLAAGYSHYKVLNQESEAAQEDDSANASVIAPLRSLSNRRSFASRAQSPLEFEYQISRIMFPGADGVKSRHLGGERCVACEIA